MLLKFSNFNVTKDGFVLLRNGFSYKVLDINKVKEIIIDYDHLSKRWILSFFVGIGICFFTLLVGVYYVSNVTVSGFLNSETIRAVGMFPFIIAIFLIAGGMFIRISTIKTMVLILYLENKIYYLSIKKKDVDKKKISMLLNFLKKQKFEYNARNQNLLQKWIDTLPKSSS